VTVSRPGDLTLTRFMAFGDSITAGSLGGPCGLAPSGVWTRAFLLEDVQRIRAYENFPASYPNVLTGLLASRYPAQATVMVNEGSPGERITDDDLGTKDSTISRLDSRLGANGPQVLLLQEGINDLNLNPNRAETFIPAVVKGLRDAANVARSRGVRVFVGALLPEHPGGCRARVPAHIEPLNDQLRAMALAEGHVFVDLHAPFVGQTGQLLGMDGLHPNELGYMKMAETFLAAIRDNLEKKP
jgi:lysophospholipase L1-like esterase